MRLLIFSFILSNFCFAQMPETDIWLVNLVKKEGKIAYEKPVNITNRVGYDNQPTFSPDGKSIYYVSVKEDKQADIFQYIINSKKQVQLTKTTTSEYSPTFIFNNNTLSTVVVETDSAQRLWQFNLDGTFKSIIAEYVDSIGYHTWLSKDSVLYYKLTNPHSLHALDLKTKTDSWLCNNPTRAFKKINAMSFIYGVKDSTSVTFRIYNTQLCESTVYTSYPSTNEDFIWHPEFGLIKSENADLLRYNAITKKWEILLSFTSIGIKKITRFVFDSKNKQLVIVNNL